MARVETMHTVDDLITDILRREGGYVNHPADRGGPTKFGITIKTLSRWLGRQATVQEVMDLDEETAREIYELYYYRTPRIDTLPEDVRAQVMDIAVNSGPKRAIRFVQRVINLAGFGPADIDGVLGPQTRRMAAAAHAGMGPFFSNAIMHERIAFYELVVANDETQRVFLKGWLRRAREFEQDVPAIEGAA